MSAPSFSEAARTFGKIGLLSFGGPAGQIALMHKILVDEKKWLEEKQYLNALNFCMLLPGPEAMQLATYAGWLLHGVEGRADGWSAVCAARRAGALGAFISLCVSWRSDMDVGPLVRSLSGGAGAGAGGAAAGVEAGAEERVRLCHRGAGIRGNCAAQAAVSAGRAVGGACGNCPILDDAQGGSGEQLQAAHLHARAAFFNACRPP